MRFFSPDLLLHSRWERKKRKENQRKDKTTGGINRSFYYCCSSFRKTIGRNDCKNYINQRGRAITEAASHWWRSFSNGAHIDFELSIPFVEWVDICCATHNNNRHFNYAYTTEYFLCAFQKYACIIRLCIECMGYVFVYLISFFFARSLSSTVHSFWPLSEPMDKKSRTREEKLPNNGIIRIIMQEWTEQSLSLCVDLFFPLVAIFESFISKLLLL